MGQSNNKMMVLMENQAVIMKKMIIHDNMLLALIEENDNSFKAWLDKYKYWDRFPEQSQQAYRGQAEKFISKLDINLNENRYLLGNKICVADMAIFPFIRQFAFVDKDWFDQTNYLGLQRWLGEILDSPLFTQVMKKHSVWQSPMDSGA